MSEHSKRNNSQSGVTSLENRYVLKRISDVGPKLSPETLLRSESIRSGTKSSIPGAPIIQTTPTQKNVIGSSVGANSVSKIAPVSQSAKGKCVARNYDQVVSVEEESNGHGWQEHGWNKKPENRSGLVSLKPPLRRKSDSVASRADTAIGSQHLPSSRDSFSALDGISSVGSSSGVLSTTESDQRLTLLDGGSSHFETHTSFQDALANAVGGYSTSLKSSATPSEHEKLDQHHGSLTKGSCTPSLMNSDCFEGSSISQRDGRNIPQPHCSPPPSNQEVSDEACSCISGGTIRNFSIFGANRNHPHEESVGLNGTNDEGSGFTNENVFMKSFASNHERHNAYGSDVSCTELAERVLVSEVWNPTDHDFFQSKNVNNSDGNICADQPFESFVDGHRSTIHLRNPLENQRRRKRGKSSNNTQINKINEGVKQSSEKHRTPEITRPRSESKKTNFYQENNILPVPSQLGTSNVSSRPSSAASQTQKHSLAKETGLSGLNSESQNYSRLQQKGKSSNEERQDIRPNPQEKKFKEPKTDFAKYAESEEKLQKQNQRMKNIEKNNLTKQRNEQGNEEEKSRAKQSHTIKEKKTHHQESLEKSPMISTGFKTKERHLHDLSNVKKKNNKELQSLLSKSSSSSQPDAKSNGTVKQASAISNNIANAPAMHHAHAVVTESTKQESKTKAMQQQKWSDDGVDVFLRKVLFIALLIWSIFWALQKHIPLQEMFVALPEKELQTLGSFRHKHFYCEVYMPLLNSLATVKSTPYTESKTAMCPSPLETMLGYNKCPAFHSSPTSQQSSLQDISVHSNSWTHTLMWPLTEVLMIIVLGLVWMLRPTAKTPRQQNRGRNRRGLRSSSRRRSTSRRSGVFGSPISASSLSHLVQNSIQAISSRLTELRQGSLQRAESIETNSVYTPVTSRAASPTPYSAPSRMHHQQQRGMTKSPSPAPGMHSISPSPSNMDERSSFGAWSEAESVKQQKDEPFVQRMTPIRTRSSSRRFHDT